MTSRRPKRSIRRFADNNYDSSSDDSDERTKRQRQEDNESSVDAELFLRDLEKTREEVYAKHKGSLIPEFKSSGSFATVLEALEYLRQTVLELPIIQKSAKSSSSSSSPSSASSSPSPSQSSTPNPTAGKCLPPVVWRHFIYALFDDLTDVDDQLRDLEESNKIRILSHASTSKCSEVIVFVEDFVAFFQGEKKNLFIDLFMSKVLKGIKQTKYTLESLSRAGFSKEAVTRLVTLGLLTATDISVHERQLSFPGLGVLVSALHNGRKALMSIVKKSKDARIQQGELGKKVMPGAIVGEGFGLEIHLLDIYGGNFVHTKGVAGDLILSPIKR